MIRELKFKLHSHRHSDDVYRFARSLLGHATDAEDATQEIFIRLWKHMDSIQKNDVRPWLLKATRNYCIDQIRRRKDVITHLSDEVLETKTCDTEEDPRQSAENGDFRKEIDQALQSLPEKLRSVFILYEINGLKYREIAETLDIPLNSVKVYLSRSRKELQKHLTHHTSWIKI